MHVTAVAAGGVDLVVREWGRENAHPLLFWPALNPWGSLQLIEAAPLLARRGFRVCSIAAPGAGESPILKDSERYRPTRLAELALEIADALSCDRFGFIGASWGAAIGVQLAVARPERVRALVLLDGGYADSRLEVSLSELELQVAAEQERFAFESWETYLEWARAHTSRWSDDIEVRYRAGMHEVGGKIMTRADARAAAWALWGLALEPVSKAHAALGHGGVLTVLIVPAALEDPTTIAGFRSHVPGALIEHLDAGHDLLHDRPDDAAEMIAACVSGLTELPTTRLQQPACDQKGD